MEVKFVTDQITFFLAASGRLGERTMKHKNWFQIDLFCFGFIAYTPTWECQVIDKMKETGQLLRQGNNLAMFFDKYYICFT